MSLRQTEDQLMRDCLLATSAFVNCVSGADGDVPTEITRQDIDVVIRALKNNSGYGFLSGIEGENKYGTSPTRDAYFALGHSNMIGQLDAVNGFNSKWNYPNQQNTLEAEWGAIANTRWLLSPVGSVTANGSANNQDVYNNFICARESFAAIEQDGYSATFLYRPPIFSSPLAQNCSLGWKMAECPRILNDAWVFNLRCTLA